MGVADIRAQGFLRGFETVSAMSRAIHKIVSKRRFQSHFISRRSSQHFPFTLHFPQFDFDIGIVTMIHWIRKSGIVCFEENEELKTRKV